MKEWKKEQARANKMHIISISINYETVDSLIPAHLMSIHEQSLSISIQKWETKKSIGYVMMWCLVSIWMPMETFLYLQIDECIFFFFLYFWINKFLVKA